MSRIVSSQNSCDHILTPGTSKCKWWSTLHVNLSELRDGQRVGANISECVCVFLKVISSCELNKKFIIINTCDIIQSAESLLSTTKKQKKDECTLCVSWGNPSSRLVVFPSFRDVRYRVNYTTKLFWFKLIEGRS